MRAGTGAEVDMRVGAVAVAVTVRADGSDKREASGGSRKCASAVETRAASFE